MPAFYERLDAERFHATEHTRGPWSDAHQHGGPPAALCAEALLDEGPFRLAQLSVDFLRPVPLGPLRRAVEWLQRGRTRARARVTLFAGDTPVAEAHATLLLSAPLARPAAPTLVDPLPEASAPWRFDFFTAEVGYHTAMEGRLARGTWGAGPVAAWLRMTLPLIDDEPVAPALRAIAAADAAHGVAPCLAISDYTLINPTLTVVLDRDPLDDWILLDAESQAQATGIGHMAARLWDRRGLLGRVVAPLIVSPRPS
ncbi:MAG: thioesterase family protein [Planctomycetes bacterium]|nr:thioesterase family protein [Planctomycetota bacterium]